MRGIKKLIVVISIAGMPLTAIAQQEQDTEEVYIYASYFVCDVTRQGGADEIQESFAPVYDAALDDGAIVGWGWLAHRTGGQWRRLGYLLAPSISALLAVQDRFDEELDETDSEEFGAICNAHDDYIWRAVASSQPNGTRGNVSLSTYLVCDMSKETRADEIVRTVLAPGFNAHVGDGMLRSWGWSEHVVGGEYRRLMTMTADNWDTLLNVLEILTETMAGDELAGELFEICNSHADYMWDIQMEHP